MAQKYHAGIEIGRSSIKIALLKGDKAKWSLEDYKIIDTPQNAYLMDGNLNKDSCINIISPVLNGFGKKKLEISFVINSKKLITKEKNFPKLPLKDLSKIVELEVEQILGMERDSYIYDYKILDQENEELKGIISYLPKDIVDSYVEIGMAMGYKISSLDAYFNSIEKYLKREVLKEDKNKLVMDIGARYTRFTIFKGLNYYEYFDVELGGDGITSQIAQVMGVTKEEAEKIKFEADINSQSEDVDISDEKSLYLNITVKKNYQRLISEVIRIRNFFKTRLFDQAIDEILIMGNGARIKGLKELLEIETGISSNLLELNIQTSLDKESISKDNTIIAAIGCALRR